MPRFQKKGEAKEPSKPTKNYTYGAVAPTSPEDLVEIEKQFHLAHRYRNDKAQAEIDRRDRWLELLFSRVTGLRDLYAAAVGASRLVDEEETRINKENQKGSVTAGNLVGRRAKPTVEAVHYSDEWVRQSGHPNRLSQLRAEKSAAWAAYKCEQNKGYVALREDPDGRAIDAACHARNKELYNRYGDLGLGWGTRLMVDDATKGFRKGSPPEFNGWYRTDRHKLAVQLQNGRTVDELFSGKDSFIRLLPVETVPTDKRTGIPSTGRRSRDVVRYVLAFRVGNLDGDSRRPHMIHLPVQLHRSFPADGRVKWVRIIRDRIGVTHRWQVQFVVEVPDKGHPRAGADGTVAVRFRARYCDDGVEVAQWLGSDGRSGRVVLPAVDVYGGSRWTPKRPRTFDRGRFDEGDWHRSCLSAAVEQAADLLAGWMTGKEVTTPNPPFCLSVGMDVTRLPGSAGEPPDWFLAHFATREEREAESVPSAVQAADRIRKRNDAERGRAAAGSLFYRLWAEWRGNRFAGDERAFDLFDEWARQYRRQKDRFDHSSDNHRAWRKDLFRRVAAGLSRDHIDPETGETVRGYRTAVLVGLDRFDTITRRKDVKAREHVEGVGVSKYDRPFDPDNVLKRVASCGLLRQILKEAFTETLELDPKYGQTSYEAYDNRHRAVTKLKEAKEEDKKAGKKKKDDAERPRIDTGSRPPADPRRALRCRYCLRIVVSKESNRYCKDPNCQDDAADEKTELELRNPKSKASRRKARTDFGN